MHFLSCQGNGLQSNLCLTTLANVSYSKGVPGTHLSISRDFVRFKGFVRIDNYVWLFECDTFVPPRHQLASLTPQMTEERTGEELSDRRRQAKQTRQSGQRVNA